MSFASLPIGWVLAGLATLAGVLFVLQRLRVRHREVTVVTTLFWQEAVQEARARVLTDRFRHPLAYLLVLLVASLVWIAAAEPRWDTDEGRDHVLLLDASAGMAREGWFEEMRDRLVADAEWSPRDRTTVILCGATPRTLLLPGESTLLLERRLEDAAPESCPETVTRTLREVLHAAGKTEPPEVRVYGAAHLDALRLAAQPDTLDATWYAPSASSGPNVGVTGLGVADAASRGWGVVDVLVEISTGGGDAVPQPVAALEGETLEPERWWKHAGGARFVYRDVPARGGTFTVSLPAGDALEIDDTAVVLLPSRPPVVVAAPANAPPALLTALRADPAVRLVADGAPADVIVTRRGDRDTPALVLVRENAQDDAIVVAGPDVVAASDALQSAYDDLALAQVDATSLATTAGRPVSLGILAADTPQVRLWESLLTDRYDLIGQRAFPAFVARAVRRVAGVADVPPVVAVGEPLPAEHAPLTEPGGAVVDPADGVLAPLVAGRHTTWSGAPLEVALLDRGAAGPPAPPLDAGTAELPTPPDLVAWAALGALALLCAEWVLFRRGRIP